MTAAASPAAKAERMAAPVFSSASRSLPEAAQALTADTAKASNTATAVQAFVRFMNILCDEQELKAQQSGPSPGFRFALP
jgi:hypothetical protein